jgi:UDP-N-acetylmuramoyl-L-alanyl-D-glutamate--2,6-diaminopimelate ligase
VFSAQSATALRPRKTRSVPLSELVELTPTARLRDPYTGFADDGISGITLDSRLVARGDLYVALPGRAHHGAEFAGDAVSAGAVAVLTDDAGALITRQLHRPVICVDDPRRAMATLAARIYGNPGAAMTMFAITGTNGKTTTSFLLDAALQAAGVLAGVIGTIGFRLDGADLEATRTTVTTPEAPELQALLAVMLERGADACVMEVSSHALALDRVDAITFDVAAFTNLGRDHLDFHGDEESYFEAKARLFTAERTRRAVINVDDPRGVQLAQRIQRTGEVELHTIGLATSTAGVIRRDYEVVGIDSQPDARTRVALQTPTGLVDFILALPGEFNVRNAITALAMLDVVGIDIEQAAAGLAIAQVPGRMQRVDLGPEAPTVFVDFAHTPQAVTAALSAVAAQAVAGQRRLVVLGCGGDRDPDKRGPIGAAAATGADVVVVTDDNPRTEDPALIREQILLGANQAKRASGLSSEIIDGGERRGAIRHALSLARAGDVVAILGKGHEVGQEINATVLPFSDVAVVGEEWAGLRQSERVQEPPR